jgi:tetratricopeptide (TPR) repeat protein
LCAFAAFAFSSAPAGAQHDMSAMGSSATKFGTVAFANSGSRDAQPAFLRGLALLHNFQYPSAAAAFQEATRIDPKFAMAYWGEAMTYNHGVWKEQDSTAARALLARWGGTTTERTATAPTQREKDYVRTLEALYFGSGTKAARDSAYARATGEVARSYPTDDDAQLFYALALLAMPRTDSTYSRAAEIAERIGAKLPDHPGALHYLIHADDDPAHAKLALPAARKYSKVAPDAPHAQHMTSHIFIALGMWDDVVAANEVSLRTNEATMGAASAAAAACAHAGVWLQYAYTQQGRLGDARRMTDMCRDAAATLPEAARAFGQMEARDIIDVAAPSRYARLAEDTLHSIPRAKFRLEFAAVYDALRSGDTAAAMPIMERMHDLRTSMGPALRARELTEVINILEVCEEELRAYAQVKRGNAAEGIAALRAAAAHDDGLPFLFGPPEVDKPPHELLGEVLLEAGRAAEARQEFRLALERTPGRSVTLLGLARASKAAGDSATADSVYAILRTNWHRADIDLPGLYEARTSKGKQTRER